VARKTIRSSAANVRAPAASRQTLLERVSPMLREQTIVMHAEFGAVDHGAVARPTVPQQAEFERWTVVDGAWTSKRQTSSAPEYGNSSYQGARSRNPLTDSKPSTPVIGGQGLASIDFGALVGRGRASHVRLIRVP